MIKHIVAFKIKTDFSSEEKKTAIQEIVETLKDLPSKIEQIKYYEVAVNSTDKEKAMDIILISKFSNQVELDIYREHEAHVKALDIIRKNVENTAFIDYVDNEFIS